MTYKPKADLKFSESTISLMQGAESFTPPAFNKSTTAPVTFSSDNEKVATVSTEGLITLAGGLGTSVITATSPEVEAFAAGEATCNVSVKAPADLKFSESTISLMQGDAFTSPTFTKATTAYVTFTSSNYSVASVTSKGVISLSGSLGTATITATCQATDTYTEGEATCKISVKGQAHLKFSESEISLIQGEDSFTSPIFTKSTTAEVTFSSSNTSVATVSADGKITLAGGLGTATITATSPATDAYTEGEATCKVSVKGQANLKFSESEISAVQGDDAFTSPAFSKSTTAEVTFTSSNTEVATVSTEGTITLAGGLGKSTITAVSLENDEYAAGEATCVVTVTEPTKPTKVPGVANQEEDGKTYNLFGQRVGQNYRGLAIRGGKLTLNK